MIIVVFLLIAVATLVTDWVKIRSVKRSLRRDAQRRYRRY